MVGAALVIKKGFFLLASLVSLGALIGCASIPRPKNYESSLLVIVSAGDATSGTHPTSDRIVLRGPTWLTVEAAGSGPKVHVFRVPPGRYTVYARTVHWSNGAVQRLRGPAGASVELSAATVLLPRWSIGTAVPPLGPGSLAGSAAPVVVETTPADRRHASEQLKDYVRIAEWAGRRVVGFAPYSPFTDFDARKLPVRIESTPPGAKITIDGVDWGRTPLPVALTPGRHLLSLDLAGYRRRTAYIDVAGAGSDRFVLEPFPARAAPEGQSFRASVLLEPLRDLGGRDGSLSRALTDSLATALRRDGAAVVEARKAAGSPDFAAAERAGVTEVVSGSFAEKEQSILLHAVLYDARSRLVRASIVVNSDGGLGLFDAIDRMSAALARGLDKKLPAVGESVVQERVITPATVAFDSRLHEQNLIRMRERRRYTLSLGPTLAGVMDSVADPSNANSSSSRINGPAMGLYASFGLPLYGPLTLHLGTMPMLYKDAAGTPKVELPLYLGARYNFHGYMNDIYVGLEGAAHYAPATAVSFSGSTSPSPPVTVGPFWLLGLNLETGVRIYTYRHISRLPTYIGLGLTLGLFGYRFDANFTHPTYYPMEIGLRVSWGTRL